MMISRGFEGEEKKPITVGPWGGQNGQRWDDGVYTGVKQVVIAHGSGIDSIQMEYDRNGSSIWSLKHGGTGGNKVDKVKFDFPNEYLTSVHGYYGSLNEWGSVFVRSLTFVTNKKKHGPFGMEAGTYFSFPMTGGKIVGFHGKSGWYLDAVGVYLKPLQNPNNIVTTTMVRPQNLATNGNEKLGFSMVQERVSQYGYNIVVGVRQKDDIGTNNALGFQKKLARQNSFTKDHFDGVEFPNKVISGPKIALLEEQPQKLAAQKIPAPLTFGPWGGNGGTAFDDGIHKGIRQIKLKRNVGIVSMRVMYDDDGVEPKWGTKLGGTGSFKSDNIVLDYPSEILTHISGTMGSLMHMGPTCIKSLTFYTNKDKYGPFGEERGPSFTSKLKEGKIVGFHGRGGLFLDALGVHVVEGKVQPLLRPPSAAVVPVAPPVSGGDNGNSPWSSKLVAAKQGPSEEVYGGVVKEPAPCGPGPWGGDGGKLWDDGAYSGIRQIYVTRAEAICSIQIEYDQNGLPVWSAKHGGNGGTATHKIKLEYPHEVLVCISGYYGPIAKDERPNVVRSLTFHTSRGKYGPYGEEIGTYFTSTTTQGKAVGFHGRSSLYLDAIGVHMQHWLGNQKPLKQSLFRKGR